jgi:hypothetical protein
MTLVCFAVRAHTRFFKLIYTQDGALCALRQPLEASLFPPAIIMIHRANPAKNLSLGKKLRVSHFS